MDPTAAAVIVVVCTGSVWWRTKFKIKNNGNRYGSGIIGNGNTEGGGGVAGAFFLDDDLNRAVYVRSGRKKRKRKRKRKRKKKKNGCWV